MSSEVNQQQGAMTVEGVELEAPGQSKLNVTSGRKRKYIESYLAYGFIQYGDTLEPKAQCVVCHKILSNACLAPAKLSRHLKTVHPEYEGKDITFFERKLDTLKSSQSLMSKIMKGNTENAAEASLQVSYRIAQAGKAHTIAETLIKPCAMEMVRCMLNDESVKKIDAIPLSNNTVQRRIQGISNSIEEELTSRLRSCDVFSLQLDESTDVEGLSILLVFVRYLLDAAVEKDLLLCEPVKSYVSGEEIFNLLDDYIKKHNISWHKCTDVCTDGAKAMVGKFSGAVTRIKSVAPGCTSSHCMIHRQALVARNILPSLKFVLDDAVKIINYVKTRPLQSRLFRILCNEMGSHHTALLLHTEMRWLSRGKALIRLFELREDLSAFLNTQKFSLSSHLLDSAWLQRLAYLADIFAKLNELNLSLQGKDVTVFQAHVKIRAISRKLQFWHSCIENSNTECFTTLHDHLVEVSNKLNKNVREEIAEHLQKLQENFVKYFSEEITNNSWINNPFQVTEKPIDLSISNYESLIEVTSDLSLKQRFEAESLINFWS